MSSYKGHSLFAFILSLLYFLNPVYCLLTIVGANVSDFDHNMKKADLYKIVIVGLTLSILLFLLKSNYFIGILILLLSSVSYFSKHRGFTHSLIGGLVLTILIFIITFFSIELSYQIPFNLLNINIQVIFLELLAILLCILFVNKRLSPIIIVLFLLSILIFPINTINFKFIGFSIFLGFLSHIILDSFSPTGVELLNPISSKRFGKKFAWFLIVGLIFIAIFYKADSVNLLISHICKSIFML
ncbi:MAG: metal-dependent hydrolase [Methanobrevibacter sp.]|jgi:inner membrane protein|nr:metal-dependent hydrolase [Candidatus Methanovirga procula]